MSATMDGSSIRCDKAHVPRWIWVVVVGYLLAVLAGWLVLRQPAAWVAGSETPPGGRAVFLALNAITLTGFQTQIPLAQQTLLGHLTLLLLMGIGSVATLLISGAAIIRLAGLKLRDTTFIRFTLAFYAAIVVIGWIALARDDHSLFNAFFLAVSAVGNAGLRLDVPSANAIAIAHTALLPLALVGGLGSVIAWDLLMRCLRPGHRLSGYTRATITALAAVYLVGVIIGGVLLLIADRPFDTVMVDASVHALNTRSAGFELHDMQSLPRAMPWVMMGLMLIGSTAAGTAGGLRVGTLLLIGREMRHSSDRTGFGRLATMALLWATGYGLLIFTAMLVTVTSDPQAVPDRSLFELISAIGNVGLSWGPISPTGTGSAVLCVLMVLGRVLPWVLVWKCAGLMRAIEDGKA